MIKKYVKKPVVIEAIHYTGTYNSQSEALRFVGNDAYVHCVTGGLYIRSLEGIMIAQPGDYIIKGVNGEFYPCKPDIFEKTYEEVK